MRAWLEFHDSTLVAVRQVGSVVEIALDGYVHRWDRIDGGWRGTGWTQPVRVAVYGAARSPSAMASPTEITTGCVMVGSIVHENLVPLPLKLVGLAELRLELDHGAVLELRDDQIEIATTGEGRLIEDLPDDMLPAELA